jgi:Polyketide cyclase / dehydrase and lipid transport
VAAAERILGGMDVDVAVEALIPYPREVVASYAGDPTNAPGWYANIVSVQWRTAAPVAVGSRMDFEARFLGRRLCYTYEVVELEPGARLVMRTADGPFPMETTYTWESVPGGTRMRLRNRGTPSGFVKVAGPVMAKAMKGAMTKDLARLTERLQHR